jgi:hypothetical protein
MSFETYYEDWIVFLGKVDHLKDTLNISKTGAWYRGQENTNWELIPSIFRKGGICDVDDWSEISKREKEIVELKESWKKLLLDKKNYKQKLSDLHKERFDQKDIEKIGEQYHSIKTKIDNEQFKIDKAQKDLLQFKAPICGERDLFDDFVFKAGKSHSISSWEILAEMRHYGVPTRLLDWTDRLDIALYFALSNYREEYEKDPSGFHSRIDSLDKPCLWILNPYNLAKKATNRSSIIDFVRQSDLDYYNTILVKRSWPYDTPVPIYPPTSFDRIRAQRGYFIVFGNDKNSFNHQAKQKEKILSKLEIEKNVALFCLEYLYDMQRLSPFEIFQDLDTLGYELNIKFQSIQNWTKTRHDGKYKK